MIYSPSQTKQYLTCPTDRMLSQEGWTSRVVGMRDWTAWVGQGVHAGLAHKYGWKSEDVKAVVSAGYTAFQAEYDHAVSQGRIIPNTFFVSEAKANIERCLEYAMKNDLLPTGFEVERVEQSLGVYNCILDVVGKRNGKPTFIDWKVKWRCKPEYIDQELEKYRYEWKEARHYPWALSQHLGQRVEEYTVAIFVLEPFKVLQRTYKVNWKIVERWAKGCKEPEFGLWGVMEDSAGPFTQWQSNNCHGGAYSFPCDYLDACWSYDLDREMMKNGGFIQIERRK